MVWRGRRRLGRVEPVPRLRRAELVPWLRAADEAAEQGWPAPVRTEIAGEQHRPGGRPGAGGRAGPGRPAAGPPRSRSPSPASRWPTTWPGWRRCATRSAPDGRIRVDANGAWEVDQAAGRDRGSCARFGLEYVEQPCRTVAELADAAAPAGPGRGRRADRRRRVDPAGRGPVSRSRACGAADVAVLKVQPLGGVRACLRDRRADRAAGGRVQRAGDLGRAAGRAGAGRGAARAAVRLRAEHRRPAGRRPGRRRRCRRSTA